MRRLQIFLIFQLACGLLMAQRKHFAYFQTDNKQSFTVSTGEKTLVSASSGFLLVSNLNEGDVAFEFDMQQEGMSALKFILTINEDAGYRIKYYQDSGWRLVNILNAELQEPAGDKKKFANTDSSSDSFTAMLADVVNAPALNEKGLFEKTNLALLSDTISLINSSLTGNMRELIYLTRSKGITDTVSIQLEYETDIKENKNDVVGLTKSDNSEASEKLSKRKNRKSKAIDSSASPELDQLSSTINISPDTAALISAKTNNNKTKVVPCSTAAGYDDFFQLRKKMAAAETDEMMLAVGAKGLKKACYNTEQVKNLCYLFLTDEGKFRFFEIAYPLVSDPAVFIDLAKLISSQDFLERFHNMLKK